MNLILLRHATRSGIVEFGVTETPLNPIGRAQAEDLVTAVETLKILPRPQALLSSPKLRARQTLAALATASSLEISVLDELDERHQSETQKAFEHRVRMSLEIIRTRFANAKPDDAVYVCSHLDFLETAALVWPSDFSEREAQRPWSTLEYQIFDWQDGVLKSKKRGRIEPRVSQ